MGARTALRRTAALVAAVLGTTTIGLAGVALPASAADPCATGGNPIVCENSKPGTDPSVWNIGDAGSDNIQGFSTDISVNVGATIGFKIDTAVSAYTIDIYRTGWYGGLGARKVASVTPSATLPQHQPQCLSDVSTELYDCGNWGLSASWAVPSTAVSGVYFALLTIPATGDSSQITFVVRDDSSHSALLFQTSDETWQAYNTYGGSDFYQGAANGRAYKVSYNRPVATRSHEAGRDFYFSSEYAMVRFLERNGYDVSYFSGLDTDRNGSLLTNHKTFLSVGHDEYWSTGQRANVEAARDAGVNLAFFSGNEVYWHTRWEPSAAGATTANRTLVSYKETWANAKIDPSATWTGTWRDPRFASPANGGGQPENGLTGTQYMSNDTDLAVTVSATEGKLRLWRNTTLASLTSGSVALAAHTVGYESNEDLDNGFRPAGLIRLSTTTGAAPQYLQDFGSINTLPGTTTHHLTLYRAPSGALVFSAGSIQWAWGLDQTHDGNGAAADPRMQQATVNLLADMGATATTLMSGLVAATASTDKTAPTVTITSPTAGASIANGTLVTASGTAADTGGRVAGVEVSTDGATWHPATGTTSWTYQYTQPGSGAVTLRVRAIDDSANIGAPATRSVSAACPCSVFGQEVPAIAASTDTSAVELGLRLTPSTSGFVTGVRFYKGSGNGGTHVGSLWDAAGNRLATATFTGETTTGWQSVTFPTAVAVSAGQTYVVSYTAPVGRYAVQSYAFSYGGRSQAPFQVAGGWGATPGGVYGTSGTFPQLSYNSAQYYVDVVFSTTDTSPLTLTTASPLAGATSVPVGSSVSAVLSRSAATGTTSLTLAAAGVAVAGTTVYTDATRTITFTPSAPLAASTTYTATVAAQTTTGTTLTGTKSWTFTTAAPPQTAGGSPVSLYNDSDVPGTLEAADATAVTLATRFASGAAGTVTGVRFYKGPNNTGTHVGALWAVGGSAPLAQATFTAESSTGWQTVTFATPVTITKDTEYVVSYRTTVGRYSVTVGGFTGAGVQRAPLRTASDSGMYTYGTGYPASVTSSSYLVDVVFVPAAQPLTVTAQLPAPADPGASTTAPVSISLNQPLAAGASLTLVTGSTPVAGTTALSADAKTLTFTPSASLAAGTTYRATAAGLRSQAGSATGDITWSFTTAAASGCPCMLFASSVPAVAAANDPSAVELGVAFTPTQAGFVTGVRFFKGTGNGGTHTGTLWSATGTALATVTFTGESATGWQTATFATPYEVTVGATYVISYLAPQGNYAATASFFTADQTVGPLTVPAVGNGRYKYGGGFPTGTWQQTNYFVDVVFNYGTPSLPTVTGSAPAAGVTGVPTGGTVAATLSKVPATGTPALTLTGAAGAVDGTVTFDSGTRTVTFTPSTVLAYGTTYTAVVSVGGTALAGGTWAFTTAAAPVASAVSLWTDADAPAVAAWNDPDAVQVGTRFVASVAGTVTAIRFYKGATNTGTHTVMLWGPDGTLLATAPSTAESASGWQTVALPAPVTVVAGQVYTAAYHSTTGRYAVTAGGLAATRTVGPLSTPTTGGAYVYGTTYPSGSSTAWYGVDLLFVPAS